MDVHYKMAYLVDAWCSIPATNFAMCVINIVTKFAAYVARIFVCKSCKFGEKILYSNWDNEFFLRDCFCWHTVYVILILLLCYYSIMMCICCVW